MLEVAFGNCQVLFNTFYVLFVYICVVGCLNIKGGFHLTCLTQTHVCTYPKPVTGFPTPYVVGLYVFSGLKWEVVGSFGIGGIGAWSTLFKL